MKSAWPLRLAAALLLVAALAGASPVYADDGGDGGGGSDEGVTSGGDGGGSEGEGSDEGATSGSDDDGDHDLARDLVERGEIHALEEILRVVANAAPGKIVGVRLDRHGGRWVYSFKIVTANGTRTKVDVDAASMAIHLTEGR